MACPSCGGRLLTKSRDRPPRLLCVACGAVVPQAAQTPLLGLIDRHAPGLLVLLMLLGMPLLLLTLTPWMEAPLPNRQPHGGTASGVRSRDASRWDPRTGVMGQPHGSHQHGD